MMTYDQYATTRETIEDMLEELKERKCWKTARAIKWISDNWVQIEKDLQLKERLPKTNGTTCDTCGFVKKHDDRDGTLSLLFYCGLYKRDLVTNLLGKFKRLEVCLTECNVPQG
jgi:hypothetical protein